MRVPYRYDPRIRPVHHPLSVGIQDLGSRWDPGSGIQMGIRPVYHPLSVGSGSGIQMGIHPVYHPLSVGIQDLGSRWGSVQFTTHCQLGSRIWDPDGIRPVYHPLSVGIQDLGSRWGSVQFTTHCQLRSRIWDPDGDPSSLPPIVSWDPGSGIHMGIRPVYHPLSVGIQDLGSRWGSVQFPGSQMTYRHRSMYLLLA